MKIDDKDTALISAIRQYQENLKTGGKPDKKVEEKAAPDEKVNISATAKDIQKLKSAVANLPEVRQDKVDELKARIGNGEYSVSGAEIADRIIEDFLDQAGR